MNVKVVGSHSGLTVGEDGATYQALEDISLMRVIPGMKVVVPCDGNETKYAVQAILKEDGPCYLRTGRCAVETITDNIPEYKFELGKGITLAEGNDAARISKAAKETVMGWLYIENKCTHRKEPKENGSFLLKTKIW